MTLGLNVATSKDEGGEATFDSFYSDRRDIRSRRLDRMAIHGSASLARACMPAFRILPCGDVRGARGSPSRTRHRPIVQPLAKNTHPLRGDAQVTNNSLSTASSLQEATTRNLIARTVIAVSIAEQPS